MAIGLITILLWNIFVVGDVDRVWGLKRYELQLSAKHYPIRIGII